MDRTYSANDNPYTRLREENEEAKEIIKEFLEWFDSETQPRGNFRKIMIKAERFLKK